MSYVQVPTRTTIDANTAGDVNQLQDNIEALKGGSGATPPTTTLEALAAQVAALSFPPGVTAPYVGTVAPTGWLLCNAETIGDVGSGADNENADYEDLFDLLNVASRWGNPGGAVWANGDTVKLPDPRGVALSFAGANGTLTDANSSAFSRTLGVGENDQGQGHKHQVGTISGAASGAAYWVSASNATVLTNPPIAGSPITDGSNGTPRTGTETKMANLPFTSIIKY